MRNFLLNVMLFASIVGGVIIGANLLADASRYACPQGTVIVAPGDTAWNIAATLCTGDVRAIVSDAGWSDNLQPGDVLTFP